MELLIVIGIIAILATATVLVLNPAELLREARDSQRLSDLDSVKSAVSLLLATAVATPELDSAPSFDYCGSVYFLHYAGYSSTSPIRSAGTASTTDGSVAAGRGISGAGWIKVDFTKATGGSPIPVLPVDPSPASDRSYVFGCDSTNTTFELDANLESARYVTKEGADGGNNPVWFEVGTDPGMDL